MADEAHDQLDGWGEPVGTFDHQRQRHQHRRGRGRGRRGAAVVHHGPATTDLRSRSTKSASCADLRSPPSRPPPTIARSSPPPRPAIAAALDALLRRHHERLWRLCRRVVGNDPDAEDALQDALDRHRPRHPPLRRPVGVQHLVVPGGDQRLPRRAAPAAAPAAPGRARRRRVPATASGRRRAGRRGPARARHDGRRPVFGAGDRAPATAASRRSAGGSTSTPRWPGSRRLPRRRRAARPVRPRLRRDRPRPRHPARHGAVPHRPGPRPARRPAGEPGGPADRPTPAHDPRRPPHPARPTPARPRRPLAPHDERGVRRSSTGCSTTAERARRRRHAARRGWRGRPPMEADAPTPRCRDVPAGRPRSRRVDRRRARPRLAAVRRRRAARADRAPTPAGPTTSARPRRAPRAGPRLPPGRLAGRRAAAAVLLVRRPSPWLAGSSSATTRSDDATAALRQPPTRRRPAARPRTRRTAADEAPPRPRRPGAGGDRRDPGRGRAAGAAASRPVTSAASPSADDLVDAAQRALRTPRAPARPRPGRRPRVAGDRPAPRARAACPMPFDRRRRATPWSGARHGVGRRRDRRRVACRAHPTAIGSSPSTPAATSLVDGRSADPASGLLTAACTRPSPCRAASAPEAARRRASRLPHHGERHHIRPIRRRLPVPPPPERDWPAQAADTIERVVGTVRDKTTGPALTVARAVVYGTFAALVGTACLVVLIIGAVRLLDMLPARQRVRRGPHVGGLPHRSAWCSSSPAPCCGPAASRPGRSEPRTTLSTHVAASRRTTIAPIQTGHTHVSRQPQGHHHRLGPRRPDRRRLHGPGQPRAAAARGRAVVDQRPARWAAHAHHRGRELPRVPRGRHGPRADDAVPRAGGALRHRGPHREGQSRVDLSARPVRRVGRRPRRRRAHLHGRRRSSSPPAPSR